MAPINEKSQIILYEAFKGWKNLNRWWRIKKIERIAAAV